MPPARALLALLFLLIVALAPAADNPVLVLIEPTAAGPAAPPESYVHDTWVRWPSQNGATGNRLLSLVTSVDWLGDTADHAFRPDESGAGWRSENRARMEARGHFVAKRAALSRRTLALQLGAGLPSDVLLLSLEADGVVKPVRTDQVWPKNRLLIAKAKSWDDVAALYRPKGDSPPITTGRILVVEYPPQVGRDYSRLWLMGNAWPKGRTAENGLPAPAVPSYALAGDTPGIVPATEVARLALGKNEPSWLPNPGSRWTGADRWIRYVSSGGMVGRALLGLLTLGLLAWGIRLVADERRHPAFRPLVATLAFVIPGVTIAGPIARATGLGLIWLSFAVSALIMSAVVVLASTIESRLNREVTRPSLVTLSAILVPLLWAFDPARSAWSTFGEGIPPEPLGLLLAALTLVVASGNSERDRWIGRALVIGSVGLGVLGAWWALGKPIYAIVPIAAWLAGTRQLRLWMAPLFWIGSEGLASALQFGIAFRPQDLIESLPERDAYNVAQVVRVFVSPMFLFGASVVGLGSVFLPSFAGHQLRRTWRSSPPVQALALFAAFLAIAGLLQPPLLDAALVVAAATLVVLIDESAG